VQVEFARAVQALADEAGGELTSRAVGEAFRREYLERAGPVTVLGYEHPRADDAAFRFVLRVDGRELRVRAEGTGPVEALARALRELRGVALQVVDYSEHALGEGAGARAAAFVEAEGNRGRRCGVGVDGDIAMASLKALVNASNRLEECS
jgi:2-isopropylmalate synthase